MDAATLTVSKLYDLSYIVVPDWDDNFTINPREVDNFYQILADIGSALNYRASYRRYVGRAWNEAHIENDHRDALLLNEAYSVTDNGPAPVVQESREAQAHALAVMRAREERTLAEVERLRREVAELRRPIIDGSDPRLEEFWQIAMDAATEENFCSEYDRIASSLGGPQRSVTYDVELEITLSSTVQVTIQRGETPDMDDIRNYVDLYEVQQAMEEVGWDNISVNDYNEADRY